MPDSVDGYSRSRVTPVLLSKATAARLWPLARRSHPSQFLPLNQGASTIQNISKLVSDPADYQPPVVVCPDDQRFFVAEHLHGTGATVLLEAVARDTALPVAVAALHVAERDPGGLMVLMSLGDEPAGRDAFKRAVAAATKVARLGWMVTIAVKPAWAEPACGYIMPGEAIEGFDNAASVACFVEKPDKACADTMAADGRYLWNTGIVVATARVILDRIGTVSPETLAAARDAYESGVEDLSFLRLDQAASVRAPTLSFNVDVLQAGLKNAVIEADLEWSDLASWGSLWHRQPHDASGNVVIGDVISVDARNSYLHSDNKLLATIGVRDVVVVTTGDAVLVADRSRVDEVEDLVARLQLEGREEVFEHKRVYRPWGYYESVSSGPRFQVKKLCVKPGGKLSLQSHNHRAEHWTCVSGTAIVTIDANRQILSENESVYIPLSAVHRLENPGKIDLMIIEVQSGSYLGEDDIVRYEDIYARTGPSSLTPAR